MAIIFVIEGLSSRMYPPPPALNLRDSVAIRAWIKSLPIGAFLLVLAAYACGSLAGGAIATLVSGRRKLRVGLTVGLILTVAGVLNLLDVPHPAWFALVSTATYLPFAFVGSRLLIKPAAASP
jgi:hypothetical protein